MWYPFDEVVNGQIKGSTPGEIIGDVQLVEGKSYKAIYTDGAHVEYVNLGNLREHCVGDLRLCSHGLTISLWLQPHVIKPGEYHYFTNGGHTRGSIGVFLGQKHERLIAFFRNDTGRWTVTNVPFEAMNWYFITMVWGPNSGARLYLNGCLAGEHITLVPDPSNSNGPYNDFILGTSNSPNHRASKRIEMTMDELKIWNAQMTEDQVWELYLSHIWDFHDDVIKWKHFPRYWPFVRGIHRSPVNSPHKGQWRGALIFSLICAWINDWVNNREAGDLRRHRVHYDVIVMNKTYCFPGRRG